MKKLYFRHANKEMEFVCNVNDDDPYINFTLEDLKKRAPDFKSYYQRIWFDENDWIWIDVGDWSCFYIVKSD